VPRKDSSSDDSVVEEKMSIKKQDSFTSKAKSKAKGNTVKRVPSKEEPKPSKSVSMDSSDESTDVENKVCNSNKPYKKQEFKGKGTANTAMATRARKQQVDLDLDSDSEEEYIDGGFSQGLEDYFGGAGGK
jgi:hypothetical protein